MLQNYWAATPKPDMAKNYFLLFLIFLQRMILLNCEE